MLMENTAPGMECLDDPRQHPTTAQEQSRTPSRVRSRWRVSATLVLLVAASLALLLFAYAVVNHVLPAVTMPQIGSTGRIGATTTACFELQDYRKVRDLRASDSGAADQHASRACGTFEAGRLVSIDKVSEADGAVCARQVGLALCFWIAGDAFAAKS